MTKDDMLKELYEIFKEISVLRPKPYSKFYEEHKDDREKDLLEYLKIGRQVLKLKDKNTPQK